MMSRNRTGLGGLSCGDAYTIWANDKTPSPPQERLSRAAGQALCSTAVQAGFAKVFIDPLPSTPADAMKLASWRRVVSRFTPE